MRSFLLATGAIFAVSAGVAFAAPPEAIFSPAQPVLVQNGPAEAVPVEVQGVGTIEGNVSVTSSPENPVHVDGVVDSVSADETGTLLDDFITVDTTVDANHVLGPVDVKGSKTIRVSLERTSCSGCGDVRVSVAAGPELTVGTTVIDRFLVEGTTTAFPFASRVYDVPGERLFLRLENASAGNTNVFKVLVFGRAN